VVNKEGPSRNVLPLVIAKESSPADDCGDLNSTYNSQAEIATSFRPEGLYSSQ